METLSAAIFSVFIPIAHEFLSTVLTDNRIKGLLVYICRVAIPPCHAAGVGAEAASLSANGPCFNLFPAGRACVFLLFQRMSVNIRADRGEGQIKLLRDSRWRRALPPHPIQLGFLMVGHRASSFLKYRLE